MSTAAAHATHLLSHQGFALRFQIINSSSTMCVHDLPSFFVCAEAGE
jgi:hypothetical protein